MKRRHHTPEQIVRKLREADRMFGEDLPMVEACKHLEVTEQTYYRWRSQYGGEWAWQADDPRRLKGFERENQRLKRIVADQALDIDVLKEVKCGRFLSPTRCRAAVNFLVTRFPVSQRRVYRFLGATSLHATSELCGPLRFRANFADTVA